MNKQHLKKQTDEHYRQSWTRHSSQPLTHIEYNVYSYSNDDSPRACWQKCGTSDEAQSAISQAKDLFRSGQYKKVEVKQRYYDNRTRQNIDETWRVFERASPFKKPTSGTVVIASLLVLLITAVGYMVFSI
ncbi:MAG: hypothetical protein ACK4NR_00520 [Micavibrio sp.]